MVALLAACASSPVKRAEEYASQDEWLKAVLEYRKALVARPGDIECRSRLKQTELKSADFYYQRGQQFLQQGKLDEAIVQFQHGMASMPDDSSRGPWRCIRTTRKRRPRSPSSRSRIRKRPSRAWRSPRRRRSRSTSARPISSSRSSFWRNRSAST